MTEHFSPPRASLAVDPRAGDAIWEAIARTLRVSSAILRIQQKEREREMESNRRRGRERESERERLREKHKSTMPAVAKYAAPLSRQHFGQCKRKLVPRLHSAKRPPKTELKYPFL